MEIGLFDTESDSDAGGMDGLTEAARTCIPEKKTVRKRLRQQRHKQMEKEHTWKRQLKQSRRDLENLKNLNHEIDQQHEVEAARQARRKVGCQYSGAQVEVAAVQIQ